MVWSRKEYFITSVQIWKCKNLLGFLQCTAKCRSIFLYPFSHKSQIKLNLLPKITTYLFKTLKYKSSKTRSISASLQEAHLAYKHILNWYGGYVLFLLLLFSIHTYAFHCYFLKNSILPHILLRTFYQC